MKLLDLGLKPYEEVWQLQKELVEERIDNKILDTLILVEHPHVITKGRRTLAEEVLETSFPVYEIERGGKATYHGPGQLVGYPIVNIKRWGVKKYMEKLEDVLMTTLDYYEIHSNRKNGATGVWVEDKKIASIGVAVKRWVAYHGFALNVNTDLEAYQSIRPCGFESSVMTSIEKNLGEKISLKQVKQRIYEEMDRCFGISSDVESFQSVS